MEFKKISELGIIINDGNYSSKYPKSTDFFKHGIPFFSASDFGRKYIRTSDSTKYISEHLHSQLIKGHVRSDDVIIVVRGNGVGKVNYVSEAFDNSNINAQLAFLRADNIEINSQFLYYLLSDEKYYKKMKAVSTGSAQPQLTIKSLKNILVPIFGYKKQLQIARILSAIDKKIEINNEINENLQKLSQALYTYWFIDFEFSNENGKPYKTTGGKMIKSELGMIPEKWLIKKISDLANVFTGKKNANENNIDGKYKFFTCSPNNLMSDTYIFDGPAVIVAGNGAYTGRTRFYDGKFELYQRTYACTVKEKIDITNIYGLYTMMKLIVEPSYMGGTHGSAIPYIVMGDIADYKFSYDEKIFLDFSKIIENNIRKISNNERQNELLVQMRDSLLPKLMNDEIDLDKIEI